MQRKFSSLSASVAKAINRTPSHSTNAAASLPQLAKHTATTLTAPQILQLQRTLGNRAVVRLLTQPSPNPLPPHAKHSPGTPLQRSVGLELEHSIPVYKNLTSKNQEQCLREGSYEYDNSQNIYMVGNNIAVKADNSHYGFELGNHLNKTQSTQRNQRIPPKGISIVEYTTAGKGLDELADGARNTFRRHTQDIQGEINKNKAGVATSEYYIGLPPTVHFPTGLGYLALQVTAGIFPSKIDQLHQKAIVSLMSSKHRDLQQGISNLIDRFAPSISDALLKRTASTEAFWEETLSLYASTDQGDAQPQPTATSKKHSTKKKKSVTNRRIRRNTSKSATTYNKQSEPEKVQVSVPQEKEKERESEPVPQPREKEKEHEKEAVLESEVSKAVSKDYENREEVEQYIIEPFRAILPDVVRSLFRLCLSYYIGAHVPLGDNEVNKNAVPLLSRQDLWQVFRPVAPLFGIWEPLSQILTELVIENAETLNQIIKDHIKAVRGSSQFANSEVLSQSLDFTDLILSVLNGKEFYHAKPVMPLTKSDPLDIKQDKASRITRPEKEGPQFEYRQIQRNDWDQAFMEIGKTAFLLNTEYLTPELRDAAANDTQWDKEGI